MPDRNASLFKTLIEPFELHFNSAHFITYGQVCENLHGHNFHVRVTVSGSNTGDGYVIDFVLLNKLAAAICQTLHDQVLLPGDSPVVKLTVAGDMLDIESFGKRFILQRGNCKVLPISNVTAELLAGYIADELVAGLRLQDALGNIDAIEVAVEEADRQWGICRLAV